MNTTTWTRYTIMHMDKKVASIRKNGSCTVYSKSFMPYNLYLETAQDIDIDERLNNLVNFYAWCSSRLLTLDRKYAKEILNSIGQKQAVTDKERAEIAISYHCVSMLDVFWVRGDREKTTFDDVCLYKHSLSDAFVDVCLQGKEFTVQNQELLTDADVAGNIATPGVAPKAWIRRAGDFYLLKDGDERDVRAEILASKIIECFDVDAVKYEADVFNEKAVSKCRSIASLEKSLVPAEYVEIYAVNHDRSLFDYVTVTSFKTYYMINIIYYLVGNTDRHWQNWGFYVDNRTNRLMELYPLMDFNKAFNSYSSMTGSLCLPEGNACTQQEAAARAVNVIGLNQIKDIDEKWFEGTDYYEMFQRRLEFLKSIENS